ncbi:hypothetical protein BN871_DE_00070 [Paenibacillus sp. P22]|nr:hypothetical protein BN871_DE_00070 [Paenibacillus sp. P22]
MRRVTLRYQGQSMDDTFSMAADFLQPAGVVFPALSFLLFSLSLCTKDGFFISRALKARKAKMNNQRTG